jgi:DNA polymerase V
MGMQVLAARSERRVALPLFSAKVAAGFPSPADDYVEGALDLNALLIERPAASFFVRVTGDSMTGAGIFPGDIVLVDRSLEPRNGRIVIAVLNGEMTIKRLRRTREGTWLEPENPAYPVLRVSEDDAFEVWGVVKNAIRFL